MGTFQGKNVSDDWEVVLEAAWEDGVRFALNSGRRTRAEQERLIREKGVWSPSNQTGAAAYSAQAPHIREGLDAHALDVDVEDHNGNARLMAWLRKRGVYARRPIAAEPWHMEISEDALHRLAKALRWKFGGYTPSERRWITEYDRLLRQRKDKARRKVLRRVMGEQRKRIWREAQKTGWNKSSRIKRYASLRARS